MCEAYGGRDERMNVELMIVAAAVGLVQSGTIASPVDYAREIKPMLAARCTSCHGAVRQNAGLRLDTAELARRGGKGGPGFVPGKSGESLIILRVTGSDGLDRMPPENEGVGLSEREIALLRSWIDQGAKAPPEPTPVDPRKHWAYQPPARATPLRPADGNRAQNPIDTFLAAGYQARGLRSSPPVR